MKTSFSELKKLCDQVEGIKLVAFTRKEATLLLDHSLLGVFTERFYQPNNAALTMNSTRQDDGRHLVTVRRR